ncbi:MAG: response regulator transcription factor [Rectinemataceae bacterium]
MTSGRGKLMDRLTGFESGADLYFVKPIEPVELNAAIENLARRIKPVSPAIKLEWYYDQGLSTLTSPRGIGIDLTGQESTLMELFVAAPGHSVHRSAIFAALEHPDDAYAGGKVETLVSRLRAKARRIDPLSELPIRARHSHGYAFLAALNE